MIKLLPHTIIRIVETPNAQYKFKNKIFQVISSIWGTLFYKCRILNSDTWKIYILNINRFKFHILMNPNVLKDIIAFKDPEIKRKYLVSTMEKSSVMATHLICVGELGGRPRTTPSDGRRTTSVRCPDDGSR